MWKCSLLFIISTASTFFWFWSRWQVLIVIVVTGHLQKTGFQLSDQLCKGFLPKVELLKSLENLLDLHLVPLSSRIVNKRWISREHGEKAGETHGHGEARFCPRGAAWGGEIEQGNQLWEFIRGGCKGCRHNHTLLFLPHGAPAVWLLAPQSGVRFIAMVSCPTLPPSLPRRTNGS